MTEINNDLDPKKLKWAHWYVTHKISLRKWLAGLLIVVSSFLFAYSLIGLIFYLIEMPETTQMVASISQSYVDYQQFRNNNQPRPLKVSEVNLLRQGQLGTSGGLSYDLIARLENVNPRWMAEFDYRFLTGNWRGEQQKGFILPQERKVILDLGAVDVGETDSIRVEISDLHWQRISSHQVKDIEQYKNKHLNLEIEDVEFTPAIKISGAEGNSSLLMNKVRFNVANVSAYSYWNLPLNIILMQGEKVAGVNRYLIDKFKSGSKHSGEVFWRGGLPMVERVVIEPDINIFDDTVYGN